MMQIRRSKRIEAVFQPRKAFISTGGIANTRIGIKQTPVTTTEDTSEPIDVDPVGLQNEETTDSDNILSGCLGFGYNVFRYRCSVCNIRTASLRSVLNHRQTAHHITQKLMKNIDLEPNTDDPNHYCKSCEKQWKSESSYRSHLQRIHHLCLQSVQRKRQPNNITPDPNDELDHRCTLCELTCQDKQAYQKHLRKHLKVKKPTTANTRNSHGDLPVWDDPSCHCVPCNFTYASIKSYNQHCRHIHKMITPKRPAASKSASSKPYCEVCKRNHEKAKTFEHPNGYIHEHVEPNANSEVMPVLKNPNPKDTNPKDINPKDPNSYCKRCQKSYWSKKNYQRHLLTKVHQIGSKGAQAQKQKAKPDVNDPNFYCRPCDKTLTNKTTYTNHLFLIHHIRDPEKKTGGLQPDINDPNNYCRACQRHYTSNYLYRGHLRVYHQMILPPFGYHKKRKPLLSGVNGPDFHGSVVGKKIMTQRPTYRRNCKDTHLTALADRKSSSSPIAATNISHFHYCAQCERSFRNKYVFTSHMRAAHGTLA